MTLYYTKILTLNFEMAVILLDAVSIMDVYWK